MTNGNRIPILKLRRDLVVVLQGALDDRVVTQLKDEVAAAIERYDAEGLVISVDGVDLMDSHISRVIYDVAHVSRIMGVETIVCGIRSLVATTLVQMGLDVGGVPTELNVERALDRLAATRRARLVASTGEADDRSADESRSERDERHVASARTGSAGGDSP